MASAWAAHVRHIFERIISVPSVRSCARLGPVLEQLQDLWNFLRVADYRTRWQAALHASRNGDLALHLNHFSASFVRWRYDTIPDVKMSLLKVRTICEQHCAKEVWVPLQDRKLLDRFVAACKDKSLWMCIATFSHAFSALHPFQTWARGCLCHE